MSGGGSFTSDQGNVHATATGQLVPTGRRARVTSIQGEGVASALLVFRSGGASGDTIATYGFGTEGLDLYIPGSGILFQEGVHVTVTNCPNISITFT